MMLIQPAHIFVFGQSPQWSIVDLTRAIITEYHLKPPLIALDLQMVHLKKKT